MTIPTGLNPSDFATTQCTLVHSMCPARHIFVLFCVLFKDVTSCYHYCIKSIMDKWKCGECLWKETNRVNQKYLEEATPSAKTPTPTGLGLNMFSYLKYV